LLTLPSLDIELEKGVGMDDIWPEGKKRGELEERIFELANGVPLGDSTKGEFDWLYSHELDQFLDAWYTLAKYYEINDDIEIGVEAVSDYVAFVRLFRRILSDGTFEQRHRQQAEDKLNELDGNMDELIKQAVTNLNNRLANK
jgi:hypothetical protein